MDTRQAFAKSLKKFREMSGLTQEDFSDVSSRVYISAIERGLKNPTLEKIDEICEVMHIHPLTLLVLTYHTRKRRQSLDELLAQVKRELSDLERNA